MNEWLEPVSGSPHVAFQIVVVPFVALLFLRSVYRVVRRDRPRWGAFFGAVLWFAAGVAILRPEVTNELAELLGIGRGTDLVIYAVAIAFVASLLHFYQKYRRLEADLTKVVRRLALQESATLTRAGDDPAKDRGGQAVKPTGNPG